MKSLDPQNLEHYDQEATTDPVDKDKPKAKRTKPLAYKAKLLFTEEGPPIGQSKADGTRLCTRIYFDKRPHWSSSIRVEIKAFIRKASPERNRPPEEDLIHKWVFRINVGCDLSTEPEVYLYPKAFMGKKRDDDCLEDAYIAYCVNINDSSAIKRRTAGQLGYVTFSFSPGQAHTEGILHNRSILGGFQPIQDQLYGIFTWPIDKVIGLTAFFALSEEKSFHVALAGVRDAFALEQAHPPYTPTIHSLVR